MSDDAWPRGNGGHRFHVGCAVELTAGVLHGMTGVVAGYSRGRNCLIRLDGVQQGVLVVIDTASLKECPACPVKVSPRRRCPPGFGFTGA